jgi:hypothetical protein
MRTFTHKHAYAQEARPGTPKGAGGPSPKAAVSPTAVERVFQQELKEAAADGANKRDIERIFQQNLVASHDSPKNNHRGNDRHQIERLFQENGIASSPEEAHRGADRNHEIKKRVGASDGPSGFDKSAAALRKSVIESAFAEAASGTLANMPDDELDRQIERLSAKTGSARLSPNRHELCMAGEVGLASHVELCRKCMFVLDGKSLSRRPETFLCEIIVLIILDIR